MLVHKIKIFVKNRRGSPLVEESILLGLSLFSFLIIASIIFDLIEFAQSIFANVTDFTDNFP
ncbi:MAG: hypothetical protein INQ03_07020 [Candidatus Heimdallarchaeota archaeon]|nr:hypothetical protein [Candidatus Heimdallarchaeota archaeon]